MIAEQLPPISRPRNREMKVGGRHFPAFDPNQAAAIAASADYVFAASPPSEICIGTMPAC